MGMRLIDADALIEKLDAEPEGGYYSPHDVISLLMTQPTIERKTGKWIKKDCDLLYCSECDLPSLHPWPYCERCGAKMDS